MSKKKYKKVRVAKPKFKVGDRVKVIAKDSYVATGEVGNISNITKYAHNTIVYDVELPFGTCSFREKELELCKDEPIEDEQPLYETTFKHKYKVGDRVELKDGRIETIAKVGLGFYIFDNDRIAPHYFLESRFGIYEDDIKGLAPKELLSREEKHLLREEIQRAYDRWDECPKITKLGKIERERVACTMVDLFESKEDNLISTFNVPREMFKKLQDTKIYSLKELGIDD